MASVYVVEVVQLNRVVKTKARTEDYDIALSRFDSWKKKPCKSVRFVKIDEKAGRILLKTSSKLRAASEKRNSEEMKSISKGEDNEQSSNSEFGSEDQATPSESQEADVRE